MTHALTIRDVPDKVLRGIRSRARRNRRSMQKEIMAILHSAVIDRTALVEQVAAVRDRGGARLAIAEIHAAIDEGRP